MGRWNSEAKHERVISFTLKKSIKLERSFSIIDKLIYISTFKQWDPCGKNYTEFLFTIGCEYPRESTRTVSHARFHFTIGCVYRQPNLSVNLNYFIGFFMWRTQYALYENHMRICIQHVPDTSTESIVVNPSNITIHYFTPKQQAY